MKIDLDNLEARANKLPDAKAVIDIVVVKRHVMKALVAEVRAAREWLKAWDANLGAAYRLNYPSCDRVLEELETARSAYRKVVEENSRD